MGKKGKRFVLETDSTKVHLFQKDPFEMEDRGAFFQYVHIKQYKAGCHTMPPR